MGLSVVLLTYNRLAYAKRTLAKLIENLPVRVDGALVKWVIASDGDTKEYIDTLYKQLRQSTEACNISITNSERDGYGRNYNLAMQAAHENEWVLPVEDDWTLLQTLRVSNVIEDMKQLNIGCARLGYIGYTQRLQGHLEFGVQCGHWLMFDENSTEPHVFAGHPRIEHVEWAREVGPWPENMLPGETEFTVAHNPKARQRVSWPLDLVHPTGGLFAHIGTERSY